MTRHEETGEPDAGKLGTSGSEGSGRKRSSNATSPATYPTQKSIGAVVVRLIVGLALLGCPRLGSAQPPTISGYTATNPRGVRIFSAPPGAPLLIEGANLGTSGTVAFDGVPAPPPASWSPT